MIAPPTPVNEAQRLQDLRTLGLLDTSPEERFDRLTRLARRLFGVPIALVSLVDADRQWFKSAQGLAATEIPRSVSFCGHAILGDGILQVPDALQDARFCDNPLVTGEPRIRFYAGCPLSVPGGSRIGTLCLIDIEPRCLDDDERALLTDLARMAEQEIAAVQMATMDALTLLSNRRGFLTLGQHALSLCGRVERPARLHCFDLDGLEQINDRFGHAEGDRALVAFARLLKKTFRESDVTGRLGGDEFAVLITDCSDRAAQAAMARLRRAVERHNAQGERGYEIAYSVGEVRYEPVRHSSIEAMLADADALMYAHKRDRRAA